MGLLTKLLTLPLTGPLDGVIWVGQTLLDKAEQELYNPEQIRGKLMELELALEMDEIDEAEYEQAEALLLERLRIARQRMAER